MNNKIFCPICNGDCKYNCVFYNTSTSQCVLLNTVNCLSSDTGQMVLQLQKAIQSIEQLSNSLNQISDHSKPRKLFK